MTLCSKRLVKSGLCETVPPVWRASRTTSSLQVVWTGCWLSITGSLSFYTDEGGGWGFDRPVMLSGHCRRWWCLQHTVISIKNIYSHISGCILHLLLSVWQCLLVNFCPVIFILHIYLNLVCPVPYVSSYCMILYFHFSTLKLLPFAFNVGLR